MPQIEYQQGLIIQRDIARLRSRPFAAARGAAVPVPEHHDRRPEMLPASDQGQTPKCAAYAMAGCIEWYNWKFRDSKAQVDPDPIYARAKLIDGIPDASGTTLDAVIHAAVDLGLAPIDLSSLTVVSIQDVKRALHRHDIMLSAFQITQGWVNASPGGWIGGDNTLLGGHAVDLIGYSDVEQPQWVGVENSWGDELYGWRGFVRMTPQQFADQFQYGIVWDYK